MNRCRVFRINADDLDRAVDDPALVALINNGWNVIAPVAIEEKGTVNIALILSPPKQLNRWSIRIAVVIAIALAGTLGILMGSIYL